MEQFVVKPESEKIARGMNKEGRTICYHGRAPCILRCGVYWDPEARTVKVIPEDVRLDWLARLHHLEGNLGAPGLHELVGLYRLTKEWNDSYVHSSIKLHLRRTA